MECTDMEVTVNPPLEVAPPSRWVRLGALVERPWFAYLTILLLQLGIVRMSWQNRDLTSGDTSGYVLFAWSWITDWQVNFAWSPLYTAFYGSMFYLTSDVVTATMLHRLLIVCAAALLVCALMRRLLPAGIAWWITVWWVVLPINFNTLYEVHLFAVLPILAAWLAALAIPGPWGRGLCLGTLGGATVLVRAELSIAFLLFSLCCMVYEWRAWRTARGRSGAVWRTQFLAYAVPLLAAAALCTFFYKRSMIKHQALRDTLSHKHTLNMSQVFSFGYQQRHPEAGSESPWDEFHDLMRRHFGVAELTLAKMIARNPRAVLEHVLWNFSLTPNGLQVLLFNATSGSENPDYAPVHTHSEYVLWLSALVGLVWCAGAYVLVRRREEWWQTWLQPRAMAWCAMLAVSAVSIAVIATQRPRPSYLFGLSITLMAATGTCLMVLAAKLRMPRWLAGMTPFAMIAFVLAAPLAYQHRDHQPPTLQTLVQRMEPYKRLMAPRSAVIFQGEFAFEVLAYVVRLERVHHTRIYDHRLLREWPVDLSLAEFFEQRGVQLVHLSEYTLQMLEKERPGDAREFLAGEPVGDWQLLACQNLPYNRFRIYHRPPTSQAAAARDAKSQQQAASR
jgi:hypothetical protein